MKPTIKGNVNVRRGNYNVVPYQSTHNTGGTMMGADPKASAVNRYCQSVGTPTISSSWGPRSSRRTHPTIRPAWSARWPTGRRRRSPRNISRIRVHWCRPELSVMVGPAPSNLAGPIQNARPAHSLFRRPVRGNDGNTLEDRRVLRRGGLRSSPATAIRSICPSTSPPDHIGERFARPLYSSLISAVLGTRLPGPGAIYISQSLNFRAPVRSAIC